MNFKILKTAILLGTTLLSTNLQAQQKKNVLFLMADDFNFWLHDIGYYPQAKTPNLDALAKKGVLFTNANCSSPVCNPSRNAMWSGMRPSTTGIENNSDGYVRDIPGFENIVSMHQYFKQNGYFTYGAGKLWHPGKMGGHNTDPENWTTLYKGATGAAGGSYYKFESESPSEAIKWSAGDYDLNDPEKSSDTYMANHIADMIRNYDHSVNKDIPFFIGCGVFRPHLPWNCNKKFYDLFDPQKLEIPKGYKEHDLDDIDNVKPVDIHEELVRKGLWKEAIRAYLANLAYADYNLGIILNALDSSSVKNNTIVVFMGDHGWHLGEKSRWSKYALYDEANHTTLIIYDPSAEGNGKICKKVVSLQDIYPTLVSLTNLKEKTDIEGRNIVPLLKNPEEKSWNWPILMSYSGTNYIKTNEWKYVDSETSPQLYHVANDPYEFDNLIKKPGTQPIIDQLKTQIDSMLLFGKNYKLKHTAEAHTPILQTTQKSIIKNNPVHKQLVLNLEATGIEVGLKIIDINGKPIINKMIAGEQEVTVQLDSICQPGIYTLIINDEGRKIREKFSVN